MADEDQVTVVADTEQWTKDIARELSRLGEGVTEGHYSAEEIRDRLWAISHRMDPYDPKDQVRRVALVVFAEAQATSDRDAAQLAETAIRRAIPHGTVLPAFPNRPRPVRIGEVMEIGMAGGNGYLWTRPTGQAWRNAPGPMWDGQTPPAEEADRG